MIKIKKTLIIKGILSICFIFFFATFLQGNELVTTFKNVNWLYLTLSFTMLPIMLFLSCLKWKILFDTGGIPVSLRKLLTFYLVGYFFSNLLPSNVGGDMVRVYYAGKEINNFSFAAVTVFIERFSGLLFLLILVCLAPLLRNESATNIYFIIPALCALAILIIILLIWQCRLSPERRKAIAKNIISFFEKITSGVKFSLARYLLNKLKNVAFIFFTKLEFFGHELEQAISLLRKKKIYLAKVIALTIIFYFFTWLNVFLAFRSFNYHVDFLILIALVPTILFVGQFPLTVLGNLGFFESVFVFYFLFVGIPGEATLAMGLLLRLKNILLGGIGFLTYITSYSPKDRFKVQH